MQIRWSDEQETIMHAGVHVDGNKVIIARAGVGKTAVTVETVRRIVAAMPSRRVLVTTYMKRPRIELERALAGTPNVAVLSYNQLGSRYLRAWKKSALVFDDGKGLRCAKAACAEAKLPTRGKSLREWVRRVRALASLAKHALPETMHDLEHLAKKQALADTDHPAQWLASAAAKALDLALGDSSRADYDDQVFLPVRFALTAPFTFDDVIIDEAQDTDAAQLWLAVRTLAPGGRVFAVGDDRQSCLSFKGADGQSMARIIDHLGAVTYPLTISRRCARAVVAEAKEIVPDYQAAPGAAEGLVERLGVAPAAPTTPDDQPDDGSVEEPPPSTYAARVVQGDAVIARVNAPLVSIAMELIRSGKDACVLGREPRNLHALIDRSDAASPREMMRWLVTYAETERASLEEQDLFDAAREVWDECYTLIHLAHGVATMDGVRDRIARIFVSADDREALDGGVVCMTAHRSKGLEMDNVYLIGSSFHKGQWEEDNLRYIGITRAKNRLVWIGQPSVRSRATVRRPNAVGAPSLADAIEDQRT